MLAQGSVDEHWTEHMKQMTADRAATEDTAPSPRHPADMRPAATGAERTAGPYRRLKAVMDRVR